MKPVIKIIVVFGLMLGLIWALYFLVGSSFVQIVYNGNGPIFLRGIIEGQDVHPIRFYQDLVFQLMQKLSLALCGICVLCVMIWLSLRYLYSKHPNIFALVLGILFCALVWSSIEAVLFIAEKVNPNPTKITYAYDFYRKDEFGIYEAGPGKNRCFRKDLRTGQFVYDVTYSVDDFGRRITPAGSEERKFFALFFGCSFTFGEGVRDDRTLPYYFGQFAQNHKPYNYGFIGLGPFDALAKIENIDFKKEVTEKQGVIIYMFMADHINRLLGSIAAMRWNFNGCYYQITADGNLLRHGDFETGRPFQSQIYRLLSKSRILKALHIYLPLKIGDSDLKLFAKVVQRMDQIVKKKFPESSFYLVIYPGKNPAHLTKYLNGTGVKILDYSTLFNDDAPEYYISPYDKHPSPLAYRSVAEQIVKDLGLEDRSQKTN